MLPKCNIVIFILCNINSGFVLNHAHINHLNNNGNEDFSVNLDIDDEDYEMISEQELDKLHVYFEDIDEFDRIARKEYEKDTKLRCSAIEVDDKKSITNEEIDNRDVTGDVATLSSFGKRENREVTNTGATKEHSTNKYSVPKKDIDSKYNNIYKPIKSGKYEYGFRILNSINEILSLDMFSNCTVEDASGVGLKAIKCLLDDYSKSRQPYRTLAIRLWNIVAIWLLLYLIVAIPLWCIKGWCCCCLCCKFFKPQETIQEAKKYLLLNPPGMMVTKRGGIIHYEPTEREKDCYEEFAHFIRTL